MMSGKDETKTIEQKPSTIANIKGIDMPEKLIRNNATEFSRKYKFDKSQYHQCIPNPEKENEFITVQIGRPNMRLADPNMTLNDVSKGDENAS